MDSSLIKNMVYRENKDSVTFSMGEIAYYIYFAVMLFAKGIGLYEGMAAYNFCLLFASGVLLIKLSMDSYSLREAVCMAALVLLGVLVWRNSGEKGPLLYILLLIGMKNIPVKRVFGLGLLVWGSAFVIQILLALAGARSGVFMAHEKLGLGHIIRWSLGYPHPNVLHISYVILIAFLLYNIRLEGKKLIAATMVCFIGNLYIFMYSISYTGFVLTVAYLICNLYFNLRKNRTKAEDILIQAVFPGCVIFSVAGPLVLKGKLFNIFDKLLNTRLYLSQYFMTRGNWTLFGDRQLEIRAENKRFTLDCSYTYLLMYGGIVIFAIMCVGYFFLINRYVKEKKNKELAIIIGILIAGISEPFLFNTAYKNLSIIFMGSFLFEIFGIMIMNKKKENSKQIHFLPFGNKTVSFRYGWLGNAAIYLKQQMKKNCRRILLIWMIAAVLAGTSYAVLAHIPDSIYILKAGSDKYEKTVYLDMENLPEDFNSRIVSYVDEKTPMYEFSGNMVTVEYVRGIVSSGLLGGVLIAGICLLIYCLYDKKRKLS